MTNRSKEQLKKVVEKDERKREIESKSGYGDKKLQGPNRPAE